MYKMGALCGAHCLKLKRMNLVHVMICIVEHKGETDLFVFLFILLLNQFNDSMENN